MKVAQSEEVQVSALVQDSAPHGAIVVEQTPAGIE
jgi:hypothetical protein